MRKNKVQKAIPTTGKVTHKITSGNCPSIVMSEFIISKTIMTLRIVNTIFNFANGKAACKKSGKKTYKLSCNKIAKSISVNLLKISLNSFFIFLKRRYRNAKNIHGYRFSLPIPARASDICARIAS